MSHWRFTHPPSRAPASPKSEGGTMEASSPPPSGCPNDAVVDPLHAHVTKQAIQVSRRMKRYIATHVPLAPPALPRAICRAIGPRVVLFLHNHGPEVAHRCARLGQSP